MGTLDYVVARADPRRATRDAPSDIYAFAAVAYECLCGRGAVREADRGGRPVRAHGRAAAARVARERPELPAAVDAVLARGLAKSPAERHGDRDASSSASCATRWPARPSPHRRRPPLPPPPEADATDVRDAPGSPTVADRRRPEPRAAPARGAPAAPWAPVAGAGGSARRGPERTRPGRSRRRRRNRRRATPPSSSPLPRRGRPMHRPGRLRGRGLSGPVPDAEPGARDRDAGARAARPRQRAHRRRPRHRRRAVAGAAAAIGGALVLAGGYALGGTGGEEPAGPAAPPRPRRRRAGSRRRRPGTWRDLDDPPEVPGLSLVRSAAVAPPSGPGRRRVGLRRRDGPEPAPGSFRTRSDACRSRTRPCASATSRPTATTP